jgi:hypothetical protein
MANTTFNGPVISTNGFEGNIEGDVTGNVTGDVTGDVTSTVYTVATLPDDITQGVVLYCSDGNTGVATLVIANTAGDAWVLASDGATTPAAS